MSRGGVHWLELEVEGRRPVCVLTRDEAIGALRNVVVALITTRTRNLESEVTVGPDDGLPRECVISLDNLRTVPKSASDRTDHRPERGQVRGSLSRVGEGQRLLSAAASRTAS